MLFTDRRTVFAAPTLSQAADLATVNESGIRDVTESTERWMRSSMNRLVRYCGDLRVDELTPQILRAWHLSLAAESSPVTANSYLRAVATVMNRLVAAGVIAASPARGVPYLKEPPRSPKAVSEETYLALRAAAADHPRDLAMVDMLWSTGCRLSGLLSMRLSELEFWRAGDELRMAAMVTEKFGASRYVYARSPQSDSIQKWIGERGELPHDVVFVSVGDRSNGKPLSAIGARHVLRRLRLLADIDPATPANAHGFRHAFAIRMLDGGHDLSAVAAFLGHADPAFTARVYVNRREDELRRKWFGD